MNLIEAEMTLNRTFPVYVCGLDSGRN